MKKERKFVESHNVRKYDKTRFQNVVNQIVWDALLSPFQGNPDGMASAFQEVFDSILSCHAPIRKKKVRNEYAPWLTSSLKNLMKESETVG